MHFIKITLKKMVYIAHVKHALIYYAPYIIKTIVSQLKIGAQTTIKITKKNVNNVMQIG